MSKVQSGESNARGNNPESKTRMTGRRQARKKVEQREELPLLNVDGLSIQRWGSQLSLLQYQLAYAS